MLKSRSANILPLSISAPTSNRAPTAVGGQHRSKMVYSKLIKQNPQKSQNKYSISKQNNSGAQIEKNNLPKKNHSKKQQSSSFGNPIKSKMTSDLSKIKNKYLRNNSEDQTTLLGANKFNKQSIEKKDERKIESENEQFQKYKTPNQLVRQKNKIQNQIEIHVRQNNVQPLKNNKIDNNNSIINHLYAHSPTKYQSPRKYKVEDEMATQNEQNLIHRYNSENKLKKYHYINGITRKNYEEEYSDKRKSRNYLYYGLNEQKAELERDKSVKQYEKSLEALKYHYYLDPNVAHKPSPGTDRLRSKSRSRNHSSSTAQFKKVLAYPEQHQRILRQRERHANSISRIQSNERQMERQVHKLGEKCRNMLNSLHKYQTPPKFKNKYEYDSIGAQETKQIRKDVLKDYSSDKRYQIQRQKIEEEKNIRQRKVRQQKQINDRQLLEIQRENIRRRQIQQEISRQRYLKINEQEMNTASVFKELNNSQRSSSFKNGNKNYLYQNENYSKNKSYNYQHNINQPRDYVKNADSTNTNSNNLYSEYSSQKSNLVLLQKNQRKSHFSSVQQFELTDRQNNAKQPTECNCANQCSCVDAVAVELNTSRLQRINNKLELYIVKNIEKTNRQTGPRNNVKSKYNY